MFNKDISLNINDTLQLTVDLYHYVDSIEWYLQKSDSELVKQQELWLCLEI